MKKLLSIVFLLASFHAGAQHAVDTTDDDNTGGAAVTTQKMTLGEKIMNQLLQIETFEDNFIGYTWDSDDKPFLDFTLSVTYELPPFDALEDLIGFDRNLRLYFSFTGRSAQYISTRASSPVIGKRFNPQIYFEYIPSDKKSQNTLFRLAYGHESNGQFITDPVTFYTTAHQKGNTTDETIDYISRGWDYTGISNVTNFVSRNRKFIYQTDLGVRYFLDYGLMQGAKEEYLPWEWQWYGKNLRRNDVSGLSASVTCFMPDFIINKLRVSYETGIAQPFANNSVKLLLGVKLLSLPLAVTYANGYNGDLAQFGKRNSSLGVTFVLSSFATPFVKGLK